MNSKKKERKIRMKNTGNLKMKTIVLCMIKLFIVTIKRKKWNLIKAFALSISNKLNLGRQNQKILITHMLLQEETKMELPHTLNQDYRIEHLFKIKKDSEN